MPKKEFPKLGDTWRHYVQNTIRARVQGPGLERYRFRRRRGLPVLLVLLLIAAAAAVVWYLYLAVP
jgi:ferric-dicitrate binding protein FerR (iron transport regulator)